MSGEISLLIIEDEKDQIMVYEDTINQFNKKNSIRFRKTICKTYIEGQEALISPYYDAAIIDLKLSTGEELEGRRLVEAVYKKLRIPVFVYSGSISQIDDIDENALLRKRLRTEKLSEILAEIVSIYKTGITSLLRPNGILDQKLSEIFWINLSKDIDIWIKHNNQNTLLRYILSHFQEYLEQTAGGDFEEYHRQEIYLAPPIKKHLHTGDLIRIDGNLYLVLTPACDMIVQEYKPQLDGSTLPVRKAENVMLAKVKEFDYKKMCQNKSGEVDKSKIKSYVTNSSYRYHYLPPFEKNSGFLIDFQDLISYPYSDFEKCDRVATISAPFIKDIISRFANYYSRQGQPTFNQDEIINELYQMK